VEFPEKRFLEQHCCVKAGSQQKNDAKLLIYKAETDFENKLMVTKGERWRRGIN